MYLFMIQIVIITVLIPISLFYLLLSLGKIDSIMIEEVAQRKIPILLNCILLFVLTQKSITLDRIPELYYYFLGVKTILPNFGDDLAFYVGIVIQYQNMGQPWLLFRFRF